MAAAWEATVPGEGAAPGADATAAGGVGVPAAGAGAGPVAICAVTEAEARAEVDAIRTAANTECDLVETVGAVVTAGCVCDGVSEADGAPEPAPARIVFY